MEHTIVVNNSKSLGMGGWTRLILKVVGKERIVHLRRLLWLDVEGDDDDREAED